MIEAVLSSSYMVLMGLQIQPYCLDPIFYEISCQKDEERKNIVVTGDNFYVKALGISKLPDWLNV